MVTELQRDELDIVKNFFDKNLYQIPALAVLDGNFPGKVYADNRDETEIALVWALSRWSYISCKEALPKHKDFIKSILRNNIFPILKAIGEDYFEIYADNVMDWDKILFDSLSEYKVQKHYENTYTLDMEMFNSFIPNTDFINDVEVSKGDYPIVPEEYSGCFSYEGLDKKVSGMTIMKDNRVISRCVNNGFIHGNRYFIDLDTFDNSDRNKGYGTYISYKLIGNQLKRGLFPLWETTVDNSASQKVANKLGFEKIEEYPVYSITEF